MSKFLLFLVELWLGIGFYISFYAIIKSKNKKIKPTIADNLLTVFLWPIYLVQVLWWRATLSDAERAYIQQLIDEEDTKNDKS